MARTASWLLDGQVTELAALRLADWVEPLLRRESYLALLMERPQVHERLVRILGAARRPQRPAGLADRCADLPDHRVNVTEIDARLGRDRRADADPAHLGFAHAVGRVDRRFQ